MPVVGEPVKLEYDSSTKFVGTIEVVRTEWDGQTDKLLHSISCQSYDGIAARRIVETPVRFDRGTAGAMFAAIVTSYLGGENIASTVTTGPTIGPLDLSASGEVDTVEDALDQLAELSGMYWDIVGEPGLPQFRAFERGTYAAPVSVTAASLFLTRVSVTATRQGYANRIYASIASGSGSETAHDQYGDGSTRSFEIPAQAAQVVSITVDGAAQSMAIRDSGATADFYWQPGSTTIDQDDAGTILTALQLLSVAFAPVQDLLVLGAQNAGEVTARQSVEGGSGKYETVVRIDDGALVASAGEATAAYLEAHDTMPVTVVVGVIALGAYAGIDIAQTITITLPSLGLSGSFLVETMEMESTLLLDDTMDRPMRYTLTCSQGQSATSDWRRTIAAGWTGESSTTALSIAAAGSGNPLVWVEE